MSSTPPVIGRRRALAGGGLLALVAVTAPACGSQPPKVDELQDQRERALRDSELATAAVAGAPKPFRRALTQVAAERAAHAEALATEIARVAGGPEAVVTPTSTSTEPPVPPAATLADVVGALRSAADSARKLAIDSSGYRAGLLASIAASCTAAHTVALAGRP